MNQQALADVRVAAEVQAHPAGFNEMSERSFEAFTTSLLASRAAFVCPSPSATV